MSDNGERRGEGRRGPNFVNNLCQISLVTCSSRRATNNELPLTFLNCKIEYDCLRAEDEEVVFY